MKLAIIRSRFNPEVTQGLLQGVTDTLAEAGLDPSLAEIVEAPGAFEMPLLARSLAESRKYDGIICLGCVIKGDTAHFEFISLGATIGIQTAMQATGVPITFGILTTYTEEQALIRSRPGPENKGREAALACLEMVRTLWSVRSRSSRELSPN